MRHALLLLLALVLLLLPIACGEAVAREAAVKDGAEEDGVPLTSLSNEEVDAALDSMTQASLVQIIESQGYQVEEGTAQAQILQAAKILVKQERDRQLAEAEGGATAKTGTASAATAASTTASLSASASSAGAKMQQSKASTGVDDGSGHRSANTGTATATATASSTSTSSGNKSSTAGWTHTQPVPEGATFWDLFSAQVMNDFGPLLRLIPEPIKKVCAENGQIMAKPLQQALSGAVGPMLGVAGKFLNVAGRGLIRLSEGVSAWSLHIASAAKQDRLKQRAMLDHTGETGGSIGGFEEEEEEETEIIDLD